MIRNDRAALESFLSRLQQTLEATDRNDQSTRFIDMVKLLGVVEDRLETLEATGGRRSHHRSENSRISSSSRVEDVSFEVKEQPLRHDFDLDRFRDKVLNLFEWYGDDEKMKNQFMAPYFALVQSSGTGKTKLLWELCQYFNTPTTEDFNTESPNDIANYYCCKTILCGMAATRPVDTKSSIYFHSFQVPWMGQGDDYERMHICLQLDSIIAADITVADNIILLFDEAQHLVSSNGFGLRCVCWWLRQKRPSKKIVAVFTGTTLQLTHLYLDATPEFITTATTTRGTNFKLYHESSGRSLYEPFYMIFTIGIFATTKRQMESSSSGRSSEYEQAVPYGRPLFALMQQKGRLDQRLFSIAGRLRLGAVVGFPPPSTCMSILGTRLQMGQITDTSMSSNLVAKGYALLTYYTRTDNHERGGELTRISFPTDPVCARLAMCMMDPDWTMVGENAIMIHGYEKRFWTERMSNLFSTGLCLPHQGDLGELAAALYLLFCGDVIRKSIDNNYKTFSVPLYDYVERLIDPMLEHTIGNKQSTVCDDETGEAPRYTEARVCFIQVVRNYIQLSLKALGSQDFLEQLYRSGCAQYVCAGYHGFNMIASIKLSNALEERYVPLLVSVTTANECSAETLNHETASLETIVNDISDSGGMAIRLVFDRDDSSGRNGKPSNNRAKKYTSEAYKKVLLAKKDVDSLLRQNVVSKALVFPEDDPFGITKILLRGTSVGPVLSNVFSSHESLYSFSTDQVDSNAIVLGSDQLAATFVDKLRQALLKTRVE